MKRNFLKIKSILVLIVLINGIKADPETEIDDPKCHKLPNGCQLDSYFYSQHYSKNYLYVCTKLSQSFKFNQDQIETIKNCSSYKNINKAMQTIYYRLDHESIIDGTYDLRNSELFLNFTWDALFKITFRFVKGFDINLNPAKTENFKSNKYYFWYSKFDFYSNGKLIKSCADLTSSTPRHLFNVYQLTDNDIYLYNSQYKTPICPLLFSDFSYEHLRLFRISNTFYRSNYPKFAPMSDTNITDINSNIKHLYIYYVQNIDLDSTILNRLAFKNIERLFLSGGIDSIQVGLLKSFTRLKNLILDGYSTRKLIHRGIDWIRDINSELKVDLESNLSVLLSNESLSSWCVSFRTTPSDRIGIDYVETDFKPIGVYPDEDFCLYERFPFEQLVIFIPHLTKLNFNLTCTYIWLIQHHKVLSRICRSQKSSIINILNLAQDLNGQIKECNFKQRYNTFYIIVF